MARLLSRQECRQIPDVPETICDTIEKEECKDVSKLPLQLPEDAKLPPQLPRSAKLPPQLPGVDTTTPPTARDATTTPPADNCRDDAQHEGVGGREDAQCEGVGGRS